MAVLGYLQTEHFLQVPFQYYLKAMSTSQELNQILWSLYPPSTYSPTRETTVHTVLIAQPVPFWSNDTVMAMSVWLMFQDRQLRQASAYWNFTSIPYEDITLNINWLKQSIFLFIIWTTNVSAKLTELLLRYSNDWFRYNNECLDLTFVIG